MKIICHRIVPRWMNCVNRIQWMSQNCAKIKRICHRIMSREIEYVTELCQELCQDNRSYLYRIVSRQKYNICHKNVPR